MEYGDLALASCSGMSRQLKSDDSIDNEKTVVDNRIPTQTEKEKKFLRSTAEWLIRTARVPPHSFVDRMGPVLPFDDSLQSLLEGEILKIHEERKDKAKKFLKDFDGKLTISYDRVAYDDEWLAYDEEYDDSYSKDGPVLHKAFVNLSVHFVDRNWNVRKWILRYSPIEFERVEKVEVKKFKKVILDYEIEDKVSTIVVPNHGDKRFDALRKWIEKKGENPIDPCFFRICCCSDLFRLMAGDLFDDMDLLLEDIRVLVGWGKMSSTNWNVTLCSLQEALDMEDKKVFEEDEYYQDFDQPSEEEWMMVRTFCKLAGCIYKVAKELFEGGYSTSNVYFHLLAELKGMLNQELMSADDDYFLCKAKKILERFDKY
ncbi:zinc finger BED domain-containing protein RICESLEEPER 2 [Eutrema salsugineum]|uniref:zinc finger BED domain-containing protein RICESLEEPER 2 n=1 Tax=Eutrema salsugineum TaxID=72664 RepID=UPI000CED099A|nr:zinc finger BED domain-containing protein RICESLEEPER 2 [Eutrema salsugineum]